VSLNFPPTKFDFCCDSKPHSKFGKPYDNSFWEKSNNLGREKKKARKRKKHG
jgi:hypothetical protein